MKYLTFLGVTFLILVHPSISFAQADQSLPPVVKNRVFKFDFFSPLTGNLTFGYEQVLSNKITLEGNIGIIGLSLVDDDRNGKGIFIKAGTRLYFTPDYLLEGMKRYNDFQGAYFKPEIIYSGFGFDYDVITSIGTYVKKRGTNNSIALMLNLGKQWVFAKTISLDLHGGIGYGTSFINYNGGNTGNVILSETMSNKYSHIEVNEIPLVFEAGFDIGMLLK